MTENPLAKPATLVWHDYDLLFQPRLIV